MDTRIDIGFSFSDIDVKDVRDDGIQWFIDLNTVTLMSGILNKGQSSGDLTLHGIDLSAGDYIHFIIDSRANYCSDSTAVTATVTTAVPTPSPVALMIIGGLALLGARHRSGRTSNQ